MFGQLEKQGMGNGTGMRNDLHKSCIDRDNLELTVIFLTKNDWGLMVV